MKQQVRCRLTVIPPLDGVVYKMQRGKDELIEATRSSRKQLVFDFVLSVSFDEAGVNFTGPFAQGPRSERFVYLNSGKRAGQSDTEWDRRAKIHLRTISRTLVEKALSTDALLETSIDGIGRDGGPACATVPLLHPWRCATSS